MDLNQISTLPVEFTIKKQYESKDCRFLDVTIDVLHTGLNFNGSIFEKEVVDRNADSIKNTPILGRIKVDGRGNTEDFEAHEYKMVENDDGIKLLYDGSAYGVIPESCNPRWVTKISSDGVLRDYFQVDAILWTKFDRAIEIFERDISKGQSMELAKGFKGYENDDGYFVFTDFKFDGCCILSTTDPKIEPAMIDSKIVVNFSADNLASEIKEKLAEYSKLVDYQNSDPELQIENKDFKEGGKNELDKSELLTKFNLKVEDLDFNMNEVPEDELEAKLADFAANHSPTSGEPDVPVEDPKPNFSLQSTIMDSLFDAIGQETYIDPNYGGEYRRYWYMDVDFDALEVYVTDELDYHLYGIPFSMDGDKVVLDCDGKKRKKYAIVDFNEGDPESTFMKDIIKDFSDRACNSEKEKFSAEKIKLENTISDKETNFTAMEEKYKDVLCKYNRMLADGVLSGFEAELNGEPAFEAIREKVNDHAEDIDVNEIENQCYCLLGKKKANFSARKPAAPVKIPVPSESDSELPYGGLFAKYNKKK